MWTLTNCFGVFSFNIKRHVLSKMTPFHTLFIKKKKKEKARNGVVLNDTIAFLLPLDAQKTGEEEGFVLLFSPMFLLSLSLLKLKKTPTQVLHLPEYWQMASHGWKNRGDKPLAGAHPPSLVPWPDRGWAFSLPFSAYKDRA